MFGHNPILPPVKGDGQRLFVHSLFHTLQGEGPHTGKAATFIRLSGCNLACDFCDTAFDSHQQMDIGDILTEVQAHSANLLVITGGEPYRQPLGAFISLLLSHGYQVQLETNGTLYQPLPNTVDIICSPKPGIQGYYPLRLDLAPHITALKFIISAHQPAHYSIAEIGQSQHNIPVYVQPMDELDPRKNHANLLRCMALCTDESVTLSIQLHKILGIA